MSSVPPIIVAAIATFNRNECLKRLLDGLQQQEIPPSLAVVVDNAASAETRDLCENHPLAIHYIASPENRGCGDGLWQAETWLESHEVDWSHLWILDDDVVVPPEASRKLLDAMKSARTGMAVPLLSDQGGKLWGFPEPMDEEQRRTIREADTPHDAHNLLGAGPHSCCWTTGACQMVSRQALEKVGKHREDFWMLGEDLEFSMRVAEADGACFLCDLEVPHLPPVGEQTEKTRQWSRRKFLSLLQNLSYLGFRCSHGFHMRNYVAGNFKRFFLTEGFSLRNLSDAIGCFWRGAILGKPFGSGFF